MLEVALQAGLVNQVATVEMKNGFRITGSVGSVDKHFNISMKLVTRAVMVCPDGTEIVPPHLVGLSRILIRGSSIRFLDMKSDYFDLPAIEAACSALPS